MFRNDRRREAEDNVPKPDPYRRPDKIILSLCMVVLVLLVAKNFLPRTSRTVQPSKTAEIQDSTSPAAGERFTIGPPQSDAENPSSRKAPPLRPAVEDPAESTPGPEAALTPLPAKAPGTTETDLPQMAEESISAPPADIAGETEMTPGVPVPAEAVETPDTPTPAEEEGEKPIVRDNDRKKKSKQWIYSVQAGSFKTIGRALDFVKEIDGMGFTASIITLKGSTGNRWYVVQIGEYDSQQDADAAASRFRNASGIAPLIRPLSPNLLAERRIRDIPEDAPSAADATESDPGKPGPDAADALPVQKSALDSNIPGPSLAPAVEANKENRSGDLPPDLIGLIRRGALKDATEAGLEHLRGDAGRFSIRLESDCSKESVLKAFAQGDFDERMFILPIRFKGQPCYVVLWGLFDTKVQAEAALPSLPSYFSKQAHRPEAVPLEIYLNHRP